MNKVYQKNISGINGDCMQAAFASLLDLNLDDVPKFIEFGDQWFSEIFKFIKDHGCYFRGYLYGGKDVLEEFHVSNVSKSDGIGGFFYASVNSPKYYKEGGTHAVIVDKNLNIAHDPNPEYQGVKYPLSDELGNNGILEIWVIEKVK